MLSLIICVPGDDVFYNKNKLYTKLKNRIGLLCVTVEKSEFHNIVKSMNSRIFHKFSVFVFGFRNVFNGYNQVSKDLFPFTVYMITFHSCQTLETISNFLHQQLFSRRLNEKKKLHSILRHTAALSLYSIL